MNTLGLICTTLRPGTDGFRQRANNRGAAATLLLGIRPVGRFIMYDISRTPCGLRWDVENGP